MSELLGPALAELMGKLGAVGALIVLTVLGLRWMVLKLDKMFERLIASQSEQVTMIKSLWERDSATRDKDREVWNHTAEAMKEATVAMKEAANVMKEGNIVARSATDEFRVAVRIIDKHI